MKKGTVLSYLASLNICNAGADDARLISTALETYRYYMQGSLAFQ